MFPKTDPELIEVSIPRATSKDIIPIQDKLSMDLNQEIISSIITNKEKDFIIKTNKSFFYEFGKLYTQNILLKAKLNELLKEKKSLNQLIIKKELEVKDIKIKNNEEISNIENYNNIKNKSILQYYKKKKRIRRKKKDIIKIFNCSFPNCTKSYPTKGALNMHIKLKHQQNMGYNCSGGDIKLKYQ